MSNKKSICIATPMYGGACTGVYTQSIIHAISYLNYKGFEISLITLFNESLITRARNILTEVFLRGGQEILLFIDADQSFRGEDIEKMYNEQKELLGAIVPMKDINWESVKIAANNGSDDLKSKTGLFNFNPIDEQMPNFLNAFEVENIGTGMMMINRSVFLKLQNHVQKYKHNSSEVYGIKLKDLMHNFWLTRIDETETLLSEDFNFCKMWQETGGKVYAVAYAEITHVGNYQFSGSLIK